MANEKTKKLDSIDVVFNGVGIISDLICRAMQKVAQSGIGDSIIFKATKIKFGAFAYLKNIISFSVAAYEGDAEEAAHQGVLVIGQWSFGTLGTALGALTLGGVGSFVPWIGTAIGAFIGGVVGGAIGGYFGGEITEEAWQNIMKLGKAPAILAALGIEIVPRYSDDPDPEDPPKPEDPPPIFDPREFEDDFEDMKNTVSPIALDLDGDGMEFVKDGAYFDYDASGFAEKATWLAKDDGWLVLDRNGDGKINDGSELFGDVTEFIFRSERRCAVL